MTNNKSVVYDCVKINTFTQACEVWQVADNQDMPLAKADANILTFKILCFMAFVFIIKQIKCQLFDKRG